MPVCGDSWLPWLPPRPPSRAALLEPLLSEPLADDPDAESPEVPEDFSFLASDFLVFFLAGFSSVAAAESVLELPDVADGEVEVLPPAALGLVDDEPDAPVLPLMPLEPDEPEVPEAPEPLVPEAPDEVSLLPDEPDDMEPLLDGVALEAPLAPDASCELDVEEGDAALLPLVAPLCASAMEDTDATTTNDKVRRVVFTVMSNSLLFID